MKTRNALTIALVMIVLLFSGDRLIAYGLEKAIDYSTLPYTKVYSGRGKADVLIFGNSRAYRHFDEGRLSQITQLKVSNLAVLGGSMEIMKVQLEDYIARYGPPKAVIVEPSCISWGNDQIKTFRILARRSPGFHAMLHQELPTIDMFSTLSHLFALNGTAYPNILHKVFVPYRQKFLEGSVSAARLDQLINRKYKRYFTSRTENVRALKEIIALSKKHRFHVEIVIAPVLDVFRANQVEIAAWQNDLIAMIGHAGRVESYVGLPLPATHFRDPVHLNIQGVEAFAKRLVEDGFVERLRALGNS